MTEADKLNLINSLLQAHPEWIEQTLAYLEEQADIQDAEAALIRLERGEEQTIGLDELERRLGLGD